MEANRAIAAHVAREKGVDPKDLISILENLGYQEPNISPADIPRRLSQRIDAMRAAAEKTAERSNQGEDIERVREKSRAFLKEAKSDEALPVLNRHIDEENAALQDRKGNDNAKAESFMKTLKQEEVDGRNYRELKHAREAIGAFIEDVYNRQRLHSALALSLPLRSCSAAFSSSM